MKSNFNQCFKWLLQDEGGYTNDKNDSGGPTNLGITIGDYRKYIKANATASDVKTLTVAQAQSIYKSKYWDSLSCDDLPSGVDNACFNYGVLAGIGRPRNNLKKFKNITDTDKLIDAICDEMHQFLVTISDPNNPKYSKNYKFRKGWESRAERLRTRSHFLVKQPVKKDNTSGPVAGPAVALGFWATLSQYIHNHPYLLGISTGLVGIAVWYVVHKLRNKNAKPSDPVQNTSPVAPELPPVTNSSMVG